MSTIKGISWDFWDTLIAHKDNAEVKSVDETRAAFLSELLNVPFEKAWSELKGHLPEEDGDFAQGISVEKRFEYLADKYNINFNIEDISQKFSSISIKHDIGLVPGVKKALEETKFRLVSVCNTKWTKGDDLRKLMEKNDITRFFENCYFSDIGHYAKPSVKAFEKAWKETINLEETLHIGDNLSKDIKGAKNIGAKSIVCRVVKKKPNIQDEIADATIYDYEGLSALIASIMGKIPDEKWEVVGKGTPVSNIKRIASRCGNDIGNIIIGDIISQNQASAIISTGQNQQKDIPGIYDFDGDVSKLSEKSLLMIDFTKGLVFKKWER